MARLAAGGREGKERAREEVDPAWGVMPSEGEARERRGGALGMSQSGKFSAPSSDQAGSSWLITSIPRAENWLGWGSDGGRSGKSCERQCACGSGKTDL
jgi:hypothetical protein